jgi:hypothetical protein
MSVTIIKKPEGIYPVYNDSFIEFESDLAGMVKATISLLPVEDFPLPFEIFKDAEGKFIFNLKELIKTRFNKNGFRDQEEEYPVQWLQNVDNRFLIQDLTLNDANADEEGVAVSVQITFKKSAVQVAQFYNQNFDSILSHSENGIDFNLTYFEGFPFEVTFLRLIADAAVTVKNLNSGITSVQQIQQLNEDKTARMFIDKVYENWTSSNFMPLFDAVNRLEFYINNEFAVNLNLKKVSNKCGVYLKWFNLDGSFNYFLFDRFFDSAVSGREIGEVSVNAYKNVSEGLLNDVSIIGKTANKDLKVKAKLTVDEFKIVEGLVYSPSVQMYSSNVPEESGEFIDVKIKGNLKRSTKKEFIDVEFTIELPELIIPRL